MHTNSPKNIHRPKLNEVDAGDLRRVEGGKAIVAAAGLSPVPTLIYVWGKATGTWGHTILDGIKAPKV